MPVVIVAPQPLPVVIVGGPGQTPGSGGGQNQRRGGGWIPFVEKQATNVIRGVGAAASGIAQNDVGPAFNAGLRLATAGLEKLGPAGMAAAAGLRITSEAVGAFKAVVDGFVHRGRELSGYSPNLAAASARADVSRLRSDIRESEQLGPQLAKLIEQQAAMELAIREMLLPIKSFMIDVLSKTMDAMLSGIQGVLEGINSLSGFGGDMLKEVIRIRKELAGDPGAAGIDRLTFLLDQLDRLPRPAPIPLPGAGIGPNVPPIVGGVI